MNEKDFEEIYRENYDIIFKYLSRNVGSESAKDLAQNSFVKVFEKIDSFKGESKISTWIYRIATNEMIDLMRRQKRESVKKCDLADKALFSLKESRFLSSELKLIHEEMKECICSYIKQLPQNYHTAIILKEYELKTNSEIASIMNRTESNVSKILYRARIRLRKLLEDACLFYFNENNDFSCTEVS